MLPRRPRRLRAPACDMDEARVMTLPDGRRFLKLDSDLLLTQLSDLRKGKYFGAAIGRIHGYQLDDIDKLAELVELEGLHVQDEIADLSALSRLKGLKYILVTGPKQRIDFSTFPSLEELRIGEWNSNATGVDACVRLERLHVRGYHPAKGGLASLGAPKVRQLELVQSWVASLAGLDRFPALETLTLHTLTKLADISDLRRVKSSLRKLVIERCKKVVDWEPIGELTELRNLLIRGCSDVPSIAFVSKLKKLETFGVLETTITDGKLAPVLGLEHLTFVGVTDKKHYSHKDAQLKKHVESRRSGVS
jgi:protein phosphatase 1 regulatory subunit 7